MLVVIIMEVIIGVMSIDLHIGDVVEEEDIIVTGAVDPVPTPLAIRTTIDDGVEMEIGDIVVVVMAMMGMVGAVVIITAGIGHPVIVTAIEEGKLKGLMPLRDIQNSSQCYANFYGRRN